MIELTYKGFAAAIQYDQEDQLFFGRLSGIDDVIGFHGTSNAELRKAFEEAVDDYLATRKMIGRSHAPGRM